MGKPCGSLNSLETNPICLQPGRFAQCAVPRTKFVIENSGDVITHVSLTHDLSQERTAVITRVTMEPVGSTEKKENRIRKAKNVLITTYSYLAATDIQLWWP